MRCTSIKENNGRKGIDCELTNHSIWRLLCFIHGDMVHGGLDERVWLLVIVATIPIAILSLWTVIGIMPSVVTFEACYLAQIFLVIATIAIPTAVLVAIMIMNIVLTMAIVLPRRGPIVVVGWW